MKHIFTTALRLNLDDPEDRKAWEYLQRLDKKQYRSYSKAIVASVNDHFDREYRIAADPYLETREKEDAFLKRVEEAIQRGLQASAPGNLNAILQLVQGAQPASPAPEAPPDEGTLDDALDFINNF